MTKPVLSFSDKLKILEKQKESLLEKRRHQILKIVEATNSITIDDRLLAGTLLFLNDQKNKNHPILDEFKSYLKSSKTSKPSEDSNDTEKTKKASNKKE